MAADITGESLDFLRGIAAAPAPFGDYPGLALVPDHLAIDPAAWKPRLDEVAVDYARDIEQPAASSARLAALRAELRSRQLDGFIVPLTDEFHGEYLPRRAQRLTWLTGFTGSAGIAIVLQDRAAIWSDGRYTLQLRDQVDTDLFSLHHSSENPPWDWLPGQLKPGQRIGYDPWLHNVDGVARFRRACEQTGAALVAVDSNPVDAIWSSQPPPPLSPVIVQAANYAGEDSAAKRRRIGAAIAGGGADTAMLTLPESIAWLLNIRGGDVPHTPFTLGMALVQRDGRVTLFIDQRKLTVPVSRHLGDDIDVQAPEALGAALDQIGQEKRHVLVDPATAGAWIFDRLQKAGAILVRGDDPCLLPKACKNPVELDGIRAAHRRDGIAVTRFLRWLAQHAQTGAIDELAAAARLQEFRRDNPEIRDLSFGTISGSGPNGAIVHYRVTEKTNRRLQPGELYLVDSGAQYFDGTTDITRTVAIGQPSPEMRDRFSRVLKGHIALACARFPHGTSGQQLDALARLPLWEIGLDYDHGTGHGVGAYLSVHEGPHRIAKLGSPVALRPGMVVSNEPGYYKAGEYGIRIENLVTVIELEQPAGAERPMLGFETLTRAPIDRALVEPSLLSDAELTWLNAYHAGVRNILTPLLDTETAAWLATATAPITR